MKLNYKKTFYVGLAFFLISLFWQAYDSIVPKILVEQFGLDQTASGVVMALDNILALFMLPLFGHLSDKTKHKLGRRTPYIIVGTIVAAIAFVGLSFADNAQIMRLSDVKDPVKAHAILYELNPTIKVGKEEKKLQDFLTKEEFNEIFPKMEVDGKEVSNPDYNKYYVPARSAYAWQKTTENPVTLVFFMALLLVVLISMATYRSPAVALMPDVTVKPLRSKANAVINLMGAAGGIIVLGLGMVFGTGSTANALNSYTAFFCTIAALMLAALIVFLWKVKENKLVQKREEDDQKYNLVEANTLASGEKHKLSKAEFRSLIFIMISVVFWFMGYNAVTSKYSVYAGTVLSADFNATLIIAQAAAIVSFIPVGMLASKIGRKKTILLGIVLLTVSFGFAVLITPQTSQIFMYILFALAGLGWATINVNSYPMVVELAKGSDVGKYTGYYYTASMAAQIATPILSGIFMDNIDMRVLFPYAAIFVALAFVTMLFVKHGDCASEKIVAKTDETTN